MEELHREERVGFPRVENVFWETGHTQFLLEALRNWIAQMDEWKYCREKSRILRLSEESRYKELLAGCLSRSTDPVS